MRLGPTYLQALQSADYTVNEGSLIKELVDAVFVIMREGQIRSVVFAQILLGFFVLLENAFILFLNHTTAKLLTKII